jgi:hypothetical protein
VPAGGMLAPPSSAGRAETSEFGAQFAPARTPGRAKAGGENAGASLPTTAVALGAARRLCGGSGQIGCRTGAHCSAEGRLKAVAAGLPSAPSPNEAGNLSTAPIPAAPPAAPPRDRSGRGSRAGRGSPCSR